MVVKSVGWHLSSDISKSSDPFPPIPKKVEFWATWVKLSPFLATSLLERGGGAEDDGMNPKLIKKLSLGAESYVTITLKGFFTRTFSQILLASIVEVKEIYFL